MTVMPDDRDPPPFVPPDLPTVEDKRRRLRKGNGQASNIIHLNGQAPGYVPGLPFDPRTYDDIDAATIPQRPWIIRNLLLRGYMTEIIAPPGIGKSVLSVSIAMSVATGHPLLVRDVVEAGPALVINNEDDDDEIDRRVAAIVQRFDVPRHLVNGNLWIQSGYEAPFRIAYTDDSDTVTATSVRADIVAFCLEHDVRVVVADPFVSTHDAEENSNTAIEQVAAIYRGIAKEANVAIMLVHHARKASSGEAQAGDMESGRGASALTGAARVIYTLARMSKETAQEWGVDWESQGSRMFRFDNAKTNFSPRDAEADWFEIESVQIGNGDWVGVPVRFDASEIKERLEAERQAEREARHVVKVTDVAADVARMMTADCQSQSELTNIYQVDKNKNRSQAYHDLSLLPIGHENGLRVYGGDDQYLVWRENVGPETRPRYMVWRRKDG